MPSFEYVDPWTDSQTPDAADLEDYQDLASDISDDDVLAAFKAISEVEVSSIQRELADATIAKQHPDWKIWEKYSSLLSVDNKADTTRFCVALKKNDPQKLLLSSDVKVFISSSNGTTKAIAKPKGSRPSRVLEGPLATMLRQVTCTYAQ